MGFVLANLKQAKNITELHLISEQGVLLSSSEQLFKQFILNSSLKKLRVHMALYNNRKWGS